MGSLHNYKEDLEGALKYYNKSKEFYPSCMYFYNIGVVLQKKKDFEGALKHYKLAHEIDPKFPHAIFNMGLLLI